MMPLKKFKKGRKAVPFELGQIRRPVPLGTRTLRYAGYTLAALAAVIAVVSLINLHDRKLDVHAAEAMLPGAAGVEDTANAVFAMYGSGIPDGQDPQAFGLRYVKTNNQWMRAMDEDQSYDQSDLKAMDQQDKSVPWIGRTIDLCGKERADCLHDYVTHRDEIQQLARDNKLRLARYLALYNYPGYADRALNRVATAYPDMQGAEHETVLGEIAIEAMDGNPDAAAKDLVADTAFWRRVLAGSGTVVTKLFAVKHLTQNYALASQIAARYKSRPSFAAILVPMTAAITPEEKDWKAAINGKFQEQAHLYAQIANESVHWSVRKLRATLTDLAEKVLLKPNDSIDRCYRNFEALQALNTVPGYDLIAKTETLRAALAKTIDIVRLDSIYNPYGKALVAIGNPSPDEIAGYIAQTHNLDGQIRLLKLQLAIYRTRVRMNDIGAFAVNASGMLYQPFAYKPMNWNPQTRELSFLGIGAPGKGKVAKNLLIAVKL